MKNMKKTVLIVCLVIMVLLNIVLVVTLISYHQSKAPKDIVSSEESTIEEKGSENREKKRKNKSNDDAELEDQIIKDTIERSIQSASGSWDIWVEDLDSNTYSHILKESDGTGMISASLIKLFIMGAAYDEIAGKRLIGSSVKQDIWNMITVSDNDAANRLIRAIGGGDETNGMKIINEFAQDIGCTETKLNRVMLAENGLENYTSAEDCARILRLIYKGKCVNSQFSEEMMDCLKGQMVNDRIPSGIPSSITVAHKTGNLTNLSNGDVGIVFLKDKAYILCVINNHSTNDTQTNAEIIRISEQVYNYYQAGNGT